MKTQIIPPTELKKEIDWSKPQLMEFIKRGCNLLVLSNGVFSNENLNTFSGTVLHSNNAEYKIGHFKNDWLQGAFQPTATPLTIQFIPE